MTSKLQCAYGSLYKSCRALLLSAHGYRCSGCGRNHAQDSDKGLVAHHREMRDYPCGSLEDCDCGRRKLELQDLVVLCDTCHRWIEACRNAIRREIDSKGVASDGMRRFAHEGLRLSASIEDSIAKIVSADPGVSMSAVYARLRDFGAGRAKSDVFSTIGEMLKSRVLRAESGPRNMKRLYLLRVTEGSS